MVILLSPHLPLTFNLKKRAHTCHFDGSPRLCGEISLALKKWEKFWNNALSSGCSSLWATTSSATNGLIWLGWNVFLSFPYFEDKLLCGL